MMLAEMQNQVAPRHLPVERRIVVEAVIPINLEAEKALIELVGLGDVEDAQNRDDAHELNGHRGPLRSCPINYHALLVAVAPLPPSRQRKTLEFRNAAEGSLPARQLDQRRLN